MTHGRPLLAGVLLAVALQSSSARAENFIYIDAGAPGTADAGSVSTLSITQDATGNNSTNTVTGQGANGAASKSAPFTIRGAWNQIAISQTGGNNVLAGGIATAALAPGANSFSATYSGGRNVHSVTIGATANALPSSVTYSANVANTGGYTNTIQEALDTTGALVATLNVTGTNNTIANASSGSGDRTFGVTITGSGNKVSQSLTGTATQSATVLVDQNSQATYVLDSAEAGAVDSALYGVNGGVYVQKASGGTGNVSLTVNGGGFAMGADPSPGVSVPSGAFSTTPGVIVQQTAATPINATVNAIGPGYYATIKSSGSASYPGTP